MKRRRNEPSYVLYGEHPARNVKLHVNAQLSNHMEVHTEASIHFAHTTFEQFAELLRWISDTVHIRVILDTAQVLASAYTTGYSPVDHAWRNHEVKRLTFHATPESTVQFEEYEQIDRIRITKGEVRLYSEDVQCIATVEVPVIIFASSGDIILDTEL